jgi:hypothetical protein
MYSTRRADSDWSQERFESDLARNGRFGVIFAEARQSGMNLGQTVFSQLIEHLPHKEFQKCFARYSGDG